MKNFVLILYVFFWCNLINGQANDSIKNNEKIFKIKLNNLKSNNSKTTTEEIGINSYDLVINLTGKVILIQFKDKIVSFDDSGKFDEFLKENKTCEIKNKIILEINNKTDKYKILEILKILELNNIKNYYLVTIK